MNNIRTDWFKRFIGAPRASPHMHSYKLAARSSLVKTHSKSACA